MAITKVAFILDDHQLFADSFSALLEKTFLFNEMYVDSDPKAFIRYLVRNPGKDIYLFLDYYLGKERLGTEIINDVRRLSKRTRIVIVSTVTNPGIICRIKSYVPEGVISKASGFDVILDCIQNIEKGRVYCCPVIDEIVRKSEEEGLVVFSLREMEVLKYFAEGLSIIETAEKLFISKHTVVSHRRKMMAKTNCNTITELLSYARKQGLITE